MREAKMGGAFGLVLLLGAALAQAQVPMPTDFRGPGVPRAAHEVGKPSGFPLFFVENRGRYRGDVRYHVEHADGVILITDTGIIFRDHGREDIVLEFPGRARDSCVVGESRSPTLVHYLIGKEAAWRTDVPTFRRLRYADLWPGIDLVLRGELGAVKYEFHVAPGVDPTRISMRYAAARLALDGEGRLEVGDSLGVRRIDPAPVSYQIIERTREPVVARFTPNAGRAGMVGFSVGPYDRSRPLIIDPALLVYSGYLLPGMTAGGIAVDASGAAIVTGMSWTSLTTSDACIARIRSDGTGFDFVTYFGSPQTSSGAGGIAVDSSGIYFAGVTYADERSFPVKVGPDLTYNGGGDTFVCKLGHDGKTIHYCGYVGGSAMDGVNLVSVDVAGAVWLAGRTWSADYPVRGGPQMTMPGPEPACVAKVAPDGSSLVLSGYLGGSSPWAHFCMGVAVDGNGDGYVTGLTTSDAKQYGFPVKIGPQMVYGGGSADTFLAKIDGRTGGLVYCGFIGGVNYEAPWSLAVDAQGAAYVAGQTASDETTFPVVGGPLTKFTQSSWGTDGFVTKVNPGGTGFVYSGFLGGTVGQGIAVDSRQRCYLGGNTHGAPVFPVNGALSPVPAGALDGFLTRLSADGRTFEYSGYLGGVSTDNITALALGPRDTVHVAGTTSSNGSFPLKLGPSFTYNPAPSPGAFGSFVAKIAEASILASGTGRLGTTVTFSLLANDDPGLPYLAGTSLGNGPTPLGSRTLGLSPDPLLWVSTTGSWPTIFEGYAGQIGGSGTATAKLHVSSLAALVGLRLHTAFLTFDPLHPLGIKSISDTASFTVVK